MIMEIEYLTLLLTLKFQSFYSTVDLAENYFMLVSDVTVISSGTKFLGGSSLKTTSMQIYGTFCEITGLVSSKSQQSLNKMEGGTVLGHNSQMQYMNLDQILVKNKQLSKTFVRIIENLNIDWILDIGVELLLPFLWHY